MKTLPDLILLYADNKLVFTTNEPRIAEYVYTDLLVKARIHNGNRETNALPMRVLMEVSNSDGNLFIADNTLNSELDIAEMNTILERKSTRN